MSFRPNYYSGDDDLHWGVFRALNVTNVVSGSGTPSAATVLSKTLCDAAAGVYVELWRHNCVDMGIGEDENAEFNEYLPPYGFSELLVRFKIDLSDITPPSWATNAVDPAAVPFFASDIFAGKEYFARRSWDLLQKVASDNLQILRVDRRHYTYFMAIRFYGGPRDTATIEGTTVYAYSRSSGYGNWPELNTGNVSYGNTLEDPTVRVGAGYPGEYGGGDGSEEVNFPPQAKFRGARLGWVTDRAGGGGWGS